MKTLLEVLLEIIEQFLRSIAAETKELETRRMLIGGNAFLANQAPTRWISRSCRFGECDACPGPAHGLQCTHRCHERRRPMAARRFTARYDGFCRQCALDIYEGDEVGYGPYDELWCKDCLDDEDLADDEPAPQDDNPSASWKSRRKR